MQIAIIFAAGFEIHHRFASRKMKKFRDMAEAYYRILDENIEDDMCDMHAGGPRINRDSLLRKLQEIRNKLHKSIISSSNITQDLYKLPIGQGLKDAYFKFICNMYKLNFQKKNPMCQIMQLME